MTTNNPEPEGPQAAKPRKKRRWLRRTIIAVIALMVIVGVTPLATVGIGSAGRVQTIESVAPHDVAIVYGAGLVDGKPGPYLTGRLEVARDLFKAGKVRVILVSGDNLYTYHDEPTAMRDWLIDQGVPAAKVVADFAGEDTYATCVRARVIFGVKSAVLVSQTYHLPRAVATCRLTGLDAVGVGDESVKAGYADLWASYQWREILAGYKMMVDVITHRQPILGKYETSVDEALGR